MTSILPQTPAQRNALPANLLTGIADVRAGWAALKGEWSQEGLEALHARLRALSSAAGDAHLPALAEAAFSAEVYLSSFVGSDRPMTPEQRETLDGLLAELEPSPSPSDEPEPPSRAQEQILLLGPLEGTLKALYEMLQNLQLDIHHVADAELAGRSMRSHLPGVLVADVDSIPQIEPILEELARIHRTTGQRVPLAFVAEKDDINARVRTVRARGDAFFSPPFNLSTIGEELLSLTGIAAGQEYRVLVIEDDPAQAEFAASILAKAGFQTESETDPMAALDTIRRFSPDLIVMDIYMPEINGIELTGVIREYNEYSAIPIVFLSGEQDTDKQVDALSVGGDDFITKPIRPRQLIAVVENRLRRCHPQRQALQQAGTRKLLDKSQFVERIAAMLSTDPMHVQAAAVLILTPNNAARYREQIGNDGFERLMGELTRIAGLPLEDKDMLARLDHDLIGILARRKTSNEIHDLAARLHETVTAHGFQIQDTALSITLGIGLAFANGNRDEASGLLRRARLALQHALQEGDSRTVPFDESLEQLAGANTNHSTLVEDDITHSIRQCLAEDSFVVLYQPILDLQERGAETFEVQLRIPTPSGELLAVNEFRKEAASAHLEDAIDKWILQRTLETLKSRRANSHKTRLFVNQFSSSVLDPDYPDWLGEQLRARHMVGTGLVLDFRLSGLSHDLKAAKANIRALHEMDVHVCLSQFPEKHAAFKVLRYVHGDYIRISKRLLKAERGTIQLITDEAHRAHAKVIVSQIDDARSIDLHWSSGADFLQGNFIHPPMDDMDYDFSQAVV